MDEMYAGSGVVFVQDILEMARVVEDLLGDEQKLQALGARSKRFIETKVRAYREMPKHMIEILRGMSPS
jgi:hypothetical protein